MEGNKIGFLQATDGIYNVDIGVIVSNGAVELAYYSYVLHQNGRVWNEH